MPGSISQSPRASTRRVRKSIAHLPELSNKENHTISGIDSSAIVKVTRKTRSKSIGPGGLEVLNETAGNSQKVISNIRSILKPTVPISPIRVIPPRNQGLRGSRSPRRNQTGGDAAITKDDNKSEQRAQEARQREAEEIQKRREARRKSLANRRVSFAPEATLHTWDIVELPEDATTSSEATNSTRRASSGSTLQNGTITADQSVFGATYNNAIPSTPLKHQNDMFNLPTNPQHQATSDRHLDAQSLTTQDLEAFSSPGSSIVSELTPSDDDVQSYDSEEDSDGDKDSVIESNLTNNINDEDEDDVSAESGSPDHTASLGPPIPVDPFLLRIDGNKDQEFTIADGGDATMDLIDDDTMLIPSAIHGSMDAIRTKIQENLNPFSPAFGARFADSGKEDNSEISMDMTVMMGGIMKDNESPKKTKRKSIARKSTTRRQSAVDSNMLADETMDLVTVYGDIQDSSQRDNHTLLFEQEEISMDMTRAIGKIAMQTAQTLIGDTNELSMDMTQALGSLLPPNQVVDTLASTLHTDPEVVSEFNEQENIGNNRLLSPVTEYTEPSEHGTINMDMTKAVGYIFEDAIDNEINTNAIQAVESMLPTELKVDDKLVAKQLMEEEVDHGQLTRSPFSKPKGQDPTKHDTKKAVTLTENDFGNLPNYLTATQATFAKQSTPKKMPSTPSKQLTPNPNRPTTPSKTPPNPNISMRKTSPKRLFKSSLSKSPKLATPSLQSSGNVLGYMNQPLVVLTPVSRRASGVGIDQMGMGSPVVAAKLDRRASIGDSTPNFVPAGGKGIRFEDPRTIELELDEEFTELAFRQSKTRPAVNSPGTQNLSQESTSSLKDIIATLSPKKNKFKGRKSLAPSARGILGKRPVELDEDEDEDATPKKLKGIQSPVKSIRLPGPMEDTTLRLGSTPHFALPGTASNSKDQSQTFTFSSEQPVEKTNIQRQPDENAQMSLQDFLNLTNIQFIDLTTTKRRHTAAADSNGANQNDRNSAETTLTDCVVAGVCTIPMLDLFQHSCRELKKYISEGRSVVQEIEKDTFEDNPALFREYISAPSDIREIMDNQFKNIKVHARHESKASWYEWRSKLFDGLKSGLVGIHDGLLQDDKILGEQEKLLLGQVAPLVERHTTLQENAELLQSQAADLLNCDQDALQSARESLSQREKDIQEKRRLLANLQAELAQGQQDILEIEERRIETMAEIKEASRVADENRGWAFGEVKSLKDAVKVLEECTGWSLSTCNADRLTFAYQESLFLSVAADLSESPAKLKFQEPISLTFEPKDDSVNPTTTHRFLLQNLKARLSTLPHSSSLPDLRSVLDFVGAGWNLAQSIVAETARVRTRFHTTERILDDSTLLVQSMILLRAPEETETQSKLHAQFIVKVHGDLTQIASKMDFKIKTVYGKQFKEESVVKFVKPKIKNSGSQTNIHGWMEALVDLKSTLLKGKSGLS